MIPKRLPAGVLLAGTLGLSIVFPAHAHEDMAVHRADAHAPIGVMGDHMHEKGEWMVSYRYMGMYMDGARDGTDQLSPTEVIAFPSAFAMPPTLRIVPRDMGMSMHMAGLMYAPTDWLTLMAMGMYVEKEMDHVTFLGMMGETVKGVFRTRSSGFGDTTISGLVRLYKGDVHNAHANLGLSLPTGSIDETGRALRPFPGEPKVPVRLPYAMQLGSGTVDLKPGVTYFATTEDWSWGGQVSATLRLGENDEDYALGNRVEATAWLARPWRPWISTSFRLTAMSEGAIDGHDAAIVGPVQTADPDNFGGEQVWAGFGVNLIGESGYVAGHRLAAEFELPLYRDLNGPQLETDYRFTLGYQKSF